MDGKRLKHAIEVRRMTQKEFAEKIGIGRTTLNAFCREHDREPTAGILKLMAEGLDVSADYLLGIDKTAEWVDKGYYTICSRCGAVMEDKDYGIANKPPYCWKCGARMTNTDYTEVM